jgi:ubiquinone biosynthesis accessory factor UbiK
MDRMTDRLGFLEELQNRVLAMLQQTPAADLQKNLKALLTQQFARMDLVTRDEFDTQAQVLARTREKLERLERRLAEMETGAAAAEPRAAPRS